MLNKITLIGNLGRDPELTYTSAGQGVCRFSLAVSRRWNDRQTNERKEETTWFTCVAFDRLAETCSQYLHKGAKVYVEGRMTSRKYTNKDGVEVTAWDVRLEQMEMLDPKDAGTGYAPAGANGAKVGAEWETADDIPF